MAGNTYEEVLRFLIEAKGDENVARLAREILSLGDAGEEAQAQTAAMLDEFGKAKGLSRTADEFRTLGTRVVELTQRYGDLRTRAEAVATEIAATEKPTARQEREFAKLTRQLGDAGRELADARGQWSTLRGVLEDSGIATKRYSDLQEQVAQKQRAAADAIRDYAAEQLQVRDAARDTANRLEEQDEAFRKQVAAGRKAKEALEAYRARAAAAADETRNLAGAAETSTGVLSTLKAAAAGVFGFFSVRGIVDGIKAIVTEGANAEDELAQLQAVLRSTGREAEFTGGELQKLADDLAEVSRFSAGEIVNAETRLLSYTNILRDEFPDAMQIVVDQSARLGISLEQSAEIVGRALQTPTKAMEALGRQGFVLEDSQKALLQQLEATGREAEAQRIIMDLLVESYGGAAAAQKLNNARGLWQSITERIKDFQQQVADAGVLDYFKQQMAALLAEGQRLAADGSLARWARQTSDAIVRIAEATKNAALQMAPWVQLAGSAAGVFARNAEQVFLLAKAYAGLKLVQLVTSYAKLTNAKVADLLTTRALTSATVAQSAATMTLGQRLRALPTQLRIGVTVIGVDWAIQQYVRLYETIKEMQAAEKQREDWERAQRSLQQENLNLGRQLQELYRESAKVQIKSAEELAKATREQAGEYAYSLRSAQKFFEGVIREARAAGDAQKEAAAHAEWKALGVAIEEVETLLRNNGISASARAIATELEGIDKSAKFAISQLQELFGRLNFEDPQGLRDVAVAVADIGGRSADAGASIRQGLEATLQRLSGVELLKLQTAAREAFDAFEEGPRGAAVVLDSVLLAALQRLGVAATFWGGGITTAGQDAIASFTVVAQAANATSHQIETAFAAALSRASTLEEAKALGALLKQAGLDGKLGFDEAERSAAALENRIRGITNAMNPLASQFEQLGIKSKAELDAARDAAFAAFEAISEGARRGEAAIEDVRAAYAKYAETARAAAANSGAAGQAAVEAQLRVLEAVHNVNTGLDSMGVKGREAGTSVAGGAREASAALGDVAQAAEKVAGAQENVASTASQIGSGFGKVSQQTGELNLELEGLSDALIKAYFSANRFTSSVSTTLWSMTMNRITQAAKEQADAISRLNAEYDRELAAMDPLNEAMEQLKAQYPFVQEAQLRATAEKQARMEDQKRRALDEARRLREEADQAAAAAREAASGNDLAALAQPMHDTITIEWKTPSKSTATAASAAEAEAAERQANLVLPILMQKLERARAVSMARRR